MFNIKLEYFGLFESVSYLCACTSLTDAILIADALLLKLNGRPFRIFIVPQPDADIDLDTFAYDGKRDLQNYFDGIYCL